jgi:hypothetical protein
MMKTKAYTLSNYKSMPQIRVLSASQLEAIEVVGNIFPFSACKLVIEELIDWNNINNDPLFKITFPQKEMLNEEHYKSMKIVLDHQGDEAAIKRMADLIRRELDPHFLGPNALEVQACVNQNRQMH